jgi:WD repeat-containing protein 19
MLLLGHGLKREVVVKRNPLLGSQEAGNYKVAHTQLLQTFLELQRHGRRPPSELSRQLMLLHSYVLVKTLVKLGDHE